MKEKTFITSFKFEELKETYAYTKDYKLGYLYSESTPTDEKLIERLISINAYQACPKATTITKEALELIHSNGLECRAWGIANTDIMKHAVDIGVDGGMTVNFPDKLVEYLAEKGKTSERI